MAKLAQLVKTISEASGMPLGTVNLTARHLREAKMISSGGRGPAGAEMTATDAVNLILGVATSIQVKESPESVVLARSAKPHDSHARNEDELHENNPLDLASNSTFGDALDSLMALLVRTGEPMNRFIGKPVVRFHVEVDREFRQGSTSPTLVVYDEDEAGRLIVLRYRYHAQISEDFEKVVAANARAFRQRGIKWEASISDDIFYEVADLLAGREEVKS